jgi:hypothetical protein
MAVLYLLIIILAGIVVTFLVKVCEGLVNLIQGIKIPITETDESEAPPPRRRKGHSPPTTVSARRCPIRPGGGDLRAVQARQGVEDQHSFGKWSGTGNK